MPFDSVSVKVVQNSHASFFLSSLLSCFTVVGLTTGWVESVKYQRLGYRNSLSIRGLSQITFALRVGRWSEKRVVYYIKSAN